MTALTGVCDQVTKDDRKKNNNRKSELDNDINLSRRPSESLHSNIGARVYRSGPVRSSPFRSVLKRSAVLDDDWFACCSVGRSDLLDRRNDVVSVDNGAEDDVFAVEPRRLRGAQEELTAVRVRSGVCHTQYSRSRVSQFEVLVGELVSVYGLPAGPVVTSEVAALTHESRYDAVERTALEGQLRALFAGAECAEVFSSLWHDIGA